MDVGTATTVESEESHFGEGMQERVKIQADWSAWSVWKVYLRLL